MQKRDLNTYVGNRLTIIIALLVAVVMVVSYIVALTKFSYDDTAETTTEASQENSDVSSQTQEESESSEIEAPKPEYEYYDQITMTNLSVSNTEVSDGSLAIIKTENSTFPSVDESKLANVYSSKSDVYGLSGNGLYLYEEAIKNLDKFIVNFYNEVPDNGLIIDKAYLKAAETNADDGTIDLSTGYSIKLSIYGSSYSFSDAEFKYLSEQAYRYGVIQRYPEGKKNYTGYDENLTIYRYVGLGHSWYMNYYKFSLEEYIDKLRTEKVVEFKSGLENNVAYVIYYIPIDETSNTTNIPVPSDEYEYSISGDGSKGFVVAVKVPVA